MILAYLKTLESSGVAFRLEDAEAELQQRLLPENCKDNLDALAAESGKLLCKQIVQGMNLGSEGLELEIKETFPLGYLTGFVVGVLEATSQKDKRIKILVLQMVIDIVFGVEGKGLFIKVVEYLASDHEEFREGLAMGFQEAVECVEFENEPTGLKKFLIKE